MNIVHYENGIREWSDGEADIIDDLWIMENETLVLRNCTLRFTPRAGIVCLGKIEAINCIFMPIDPNGGNGKWLFEKMGWKGVADIGKRRSTFEKCTFKGGRGRPLIELTDQYVGRYFDELNDLEILDGWSELDEKDIQEAYQETYGGALIALNTSIKECEFIGCKVSGNGGAVIATFNVDIDHCRFEHCRAGGDGGALVIKNHSTIKNTLFISCRAGDDRRGGRID